MLNIISCRCYLFYIPSQLFNDAIEAAIAYKMNPTDVSDQIMYELETLK